MTLISSATCRKVHKILFLPTKYGVTSSAQVSVVSVWLVRNKSSINTTTVGQVYHTLLQEREAKGIKDIAISRVEQISPFPYDLVCPPFSPPLECRLTVPQIAPHLDAYPNADILWCQV